MTNSTPDELFVGLVALVLVPIIGIRIVRGLRSGRLPLYHSYIERSEDRAKFAALMAIHAAVLILIVIVAVDLLFALRLKESLL